MKESAKELKEFYGEEDRDGEFCCVGCWFFSDNRGCLDRLDDEESNLCMKSCKKNITNKYIILTKERTERSICKIMEINGIREMELLEQAGKWKN